MNLHVRRRLLQRLQQRVERVARQHVDFVDDEHLGARLQRAVADGLDDLAHVVHAGVAGGVHLDHVRVAVGQDGDAVGAHAAGSAVGPPVPSGPTQLSARAMMRAVVVLPTPRTPVSMKAWAMRPSAKALRRVRTIASWPIRSSKRGGPVFARQHPVGDGGRLRRLARPEPRRTGRGRRGRVRQGVVQHSQTSGGAGLSWREGKGWEAERTTRAETRCGCFLPDLTGLARRPSAADLPAQS